MKIDSAMLHEIAAMPAEAMAVSIRFLAVQLEAEEVRQSASALRSSNHKTGSGSLIMQDLRRSVYERDGFACVYCGSDERLTCDHVIPVSKGGKTVLENLATCCKSCNSKKKDRERKEFARSSDKGRTKTGQEAEASRKTEALARVEYNNNLPNLEDLNNLPPSPSKPKTAETPEGFEDFWELYPQREGDRDRKGAVKAFRAARKRIDLKTLLDGARAYAAFCVEKGKVGTPYVKQARSWLNADGWTEQLQKPSSQAPAQTAIPILVDTPEWNAWKAAKGGKLFAQDVRDPQSNRVIGRGCYQLTKFPPSEARAA